jgi:hypothetical protein
MKNDIVMLYVAVLKLGCIIYMSRLNDFPETKLPPNEYYITIRSKKEEIIRVRLRPNED